MKHEARWDTACAENAELFGKSEPGVVYAVQTRYLEHMVPDIIENDEHFAEKYVMFSVDWQIRGIFSTRAEARRYADEYDKIPFLVSNIHKHFLNKPDTDLADLYETRTKLADVLRRAQDKYGIEPPRGWRQGEKGRIA